MDFQAYVDGFGAMTCIISVEKKDKGYGKIRIVTGNESYIGSIERPFQNAELLTTKFVPNSEYTNYLTQDLNFEDSCYRAAVEKKCVHAYAHPDRLNVWFNMTFLPVNCDNGDGLCYCTYTMEINQVADTKRLSNVSGDIAAAVLGTSMKLRGARDFHAAMGDVIKDIRELCGAEHCCILLMNTEKHYCSVLAEDYSEDSKLIRVVSDASIDFYSIASTWEDTISGSNCLIAKNDYEMDVVKKRNPVWYESLRDAGADTIVLFPLRSNSNELLGYIWAVNFDPENAGKIKEALELTTFVLSSEISNYLLFDRLRILSSTDMLTGVMNRNEMNGLVDRISRGAEGTGPCGIIFADLNGLKTVNDKEGHAEGDMLLKNAAAALMKVFDMQEIFRAGGDEFCIIADGADDDILRRKAADIRKAAEVYSNVHFAIGCCAVNDKRDIRLALQKADELMYDDKKAYYLAHPERRHGTKI
ncbi:MAG: GGDEF domain-containing protein [Oscillospiraceae bacterium]|nr:GGDEF domain-containing protein [Oscillospiraceae bacterium]